MDRKSLIGFVIIAVVVTVWMMIKNNNDQQEAAILQHQQDSIARIDSINHVKAVAKAKAEEDSLKKIVVKDSTLNLDSVRLAKKNEVYGAFAAASKGDNTPVVLENEKIKMSIYPRGGRIGQVEIKGQKTHAGKPLILFYPDSTHFGLSFFDNKSRRIGTDSLYFQSTSKSVSVAGKDSSSVSFRLYGDSAKTRYIEYLYTLRGNTFMPSFNINFVGCETFFAQQPMVDLNWSMVTPQQEKKVKNERAATTVYYYFDGEDGIEDLDITKDEKEKVTGEPKWISFKQQFFSSILVANSHFENNSEVEVIVPTDPFTIKKMRANLPLAIKNGTKESFGMQFYFGPNDYHELKNQNLHFEKQINYGWGIFGWLNRGVFIPVFNWLGDMLPNNYGLVILLLTIMVKLILFPIAYKSFLSSAKMRVLKPEMDELNEKFKDDPMKKQSATMEMYRKAGVNPAAGCIPLLLQLPILFALIRLFPAAFELRQQHFLWAEDLSTYDSIWDFGFNIPWYGDHMSLFALLMTISTLLYTWMNQQMLSPGSAQLPGMKWLIYLMPIMFLGFLNDYSAALSYYYFLSNIITFGQMILMRRFVDEKAIHAKIQENKKKPAKSGFLQRLEAAQRERVKQIQDQKGGKKK